MKVIIADPMCAKGYVCAWDYATAIDRLVECGWLTSDIEFETPFGEEDGKTIKEVLGEDWINILKSWDIEKVNDFFNHLITFTEVEIWEA